MRSPGEAEHGLGPVYLIEVRPDATGPWFTVTHVGDQLLVWWAAGYANAAAEEVRESTVYAEVRAVPAWSDYVVTVAETAASDPRRLRAEAIDARARPVAERRAATTDFASRIAQNEDLRLAPAK
jgi:hypothetical protein